MTNSMKQTVVTNPIWWKRRSALERGLMVIAIFGGLVCFALAISICVLVGSNFRSCNVTLTAETGLTGHGNMSGSSKKDDDVCFTSGCVHTASMVMKNMDLDVHPCDNFYKFACGGFIKSTVIPDNQMGIDTFSVTGEKLQQQLRTSIESKIEANDRKPFRLVKNLYKSCMNTTAIEAQGLKPLKTLLKKLGGWPVVDGDRWNNSDFDWISSIYKFHDAGSSVNYFIEFGISSDLKNSTKNVIYLDQPPLGLSREHLLKGFDDKKVQAYYSYMVDIAVMVGADREDAIAELKESLLFEIKLGNIIVPLDIRLNVTKVYNPMSISELGNKYPSIPWREYFGKLLQSSISLDDNEIVIVISPSYISRLENLMSITPKKVQANYVMWRATKALLRYLNDDVRKRRIAYSSAFSSRSERNSRSKECVSIVSENLPIGVAAMYVRKYFTQEAKNNIKEMVMDIRKQLMIILNKVEWMDDKTRQSALDKAAAMSSDIAYPDEILDDNKLEEIYAKLELSGGYYLENILNLTVFDTDDSFGKLRTPVNKTEWSNHGMLTVVNAFNSPMENRIIIPAGILQGKFFSNDRPRYMNYGAIGFIIGHEITHGFDNLGRQFDKDGNLVDWWAPLTVKKYLERVECIIHQYGNYTVEEVGMKINGTYTQNENIADNGGFKEAYLAYINWVDRNSPEPKLPGLNYTQRQMFWISAANVWCLNIRKEAIKHHTSSSRHSPHEFRIIGPLSNMPEFSKDFNCPSGSRMNPKNKCSVW